MKGLARNDPRIGSIRLACAGADETIYRLETMPWSPDCARGLGVRGCAVPVEAKLHRMGNGEWARSSAGEHYVDIVGVTGSIPVAPTIFLS